MSTNSLGQTRHKKLAADILSEFEIISREFNSFQTSSNLSCLKGCGKCCFKPDIYCSPYELLPLAIELLEKGDAQRMYDYALEKEDGRCIFLFVQNEKEFGGQCSHYEFRPLICRTFGVSARHGKNETINFSVCAPLKEEKKEAYEALSHETTNIAFIDFCKTRMASIDPLLLEEEKPINESLKIILEEVLFYSSFN